MAGRSKPKAARQPVDEELTRVRVIEAAISCILEKGFYRASSNEIARTAGVTWGVIQYHFGSREALMVAVLDDAGRRLDDLIRSADVSGETVQERLSKYLQVLNTYYGEPAYLALLQIMLNLGRDPSTSQETARVLVESNQRVRGQLHSLEEQVLGASDVDPVLHGTLIHACRGIILSQLVYRNTTPRQVQRNQTETDADGQTRLLVEALSSIINPRDSLG